MTENKKENKWVGVGKPNAHFHEWLTTGGWIEIDRNIYKGTVFTATKDDLYKHWYGEARRQKKNPNHRIAPYAPATRRHIRTKNIPPEQIIGTL